MKNKIIILSILVATASLLSAQTLGIIKGTVVEESSSNPLDFATISLFLTSDGSLVTGAISDEKGFFQLEVAPGNYRAKVEFLSYQAKTIEDIKVGKENMELNLGTINMVPEAALFNEVVVQAEKSTMQMSLDKRTFNVGKDLGSQGGTAEDILDNVPSVNVDVEGQVTLRGSGNVRILVDGKPSGLIGISNTNGLRQLPAEMIEKVEVITNPSARYEAEGMAGIINIVLKKNRKSGLNGSLDLTAGTPQNYGAAVNLNYRKDRFNFFTNLGYRFRRSPGFSNSYQEFYPGDTTFITIQDGDRERGGGSVNLRLGADYFFSPKDILTTSFNYRDGNEDNYSSILYEDYIFNLDNPIAFSERVQNELELESNLEYVLTYKKTFDKKDHELTADLRYQSNGEEEDSDIVQQFFTGNKLPEGSDLMQRSNNKENESRLILQFDYVYPFSKEGKFEVGYQSSIRNIDNDFLVEEFNDVEWFALEGLSNNFQYDENIHATYLIFGNKSGKFSYQLGLRGEYSDVSTQLIQTNEINDRSYFNLFPSTHFTYDLPQDNAIQVSYSRRIRRPRFWDLNPFFTFSDNRNFFSGNPDLDPEFSDSYEIGHIKYWEQGSLSSSVYYRHTEGAIERLRTIKEDGTTFARPENLATEDDFGIEFTANYAPYRWWKMDGNFNFFRSITDGGNIDPSLYADTYSWFTRFTSRMTLWKKVDVQLRWNYRAAQKTTQGRREAYNVLDFAANRDILNKKATLTLSVRDLFNSRIRRYTTIGEDFFRESESQWRPGRTVRLSFNYRLNQKKQRGRGGRRGGDDGGFEGGEF